MKEFVAERNICHTTELPRKEETQYVVNGETKHLLLKRIDIIFNNEESVGIIIEDLTPTKMAEREKLSHEFQSRLVRTITNEIRTPINAISGSIEILDNIHKGTINENQTKDKKIYVKTIQNGIRFLISFVESIYEYIYIYI